jgi:tRNA(Arg) A34 adenosine deaminase TadA
MRDSRFSGWGPAHGASVLNAGMNVDERHLRQAIELAARARANGNHPFGSLLTDAIGDVVLEAENTVLTGRDCTGHAELNLVRAASQKYDPAAFLRACTLYTSTEPCAMCSGATGT